MIAAIGPAITASKSVFRYGIAGHLNCVLDSRASFGISIGVVIPITEDRELNTQSQKRPTGSSAGSPPVQPRGSGAAR